MKKQFIAILALVIIAHLAIAEQPAGTPVKDEQLLKFEAKVETLIVKDNNVPAALLEYASAAKANPQVVYYRQQYAILQRVAKMQSLLKTETNAEKWKSYAKAIRGYFYSKGYYSASLPIDMEAANKFNSGEYAANALETLLLTGKKDEAAKFSSDKKPADKTVRYQTLALVSEAYAGKTKETMENLQTVKIDPKVDYESYFDYARIYNAANDKEKTFSNLKAFLESTPPTEMPSAHEMITRSADFASLSGSEDFNKVLATESKVVQSGCTGGSSCGSCKLKDKCPSNK
jgi:hypothetical protein